MFALFGKETNCKLSKAERDWPFSQGGIKPNLETKYNVTLSKT